MFFALLTALSFAQEPTQAPAAPASGPKTYTLDAAKSKLYVVVAYDREATIAGHDHIVSATTFDGKVTWDAANPAACDIRISFPVSALAVDPGSSRTWEGLEGTTADGDKAKIKENLAGKHQLQADLFPSISYQSTSCSGSGGTYDVKGNLTIHGKSKAVTTKMTIQADGAFAARGSFKATHADFGIEPFSALLGALKNAPELKFVVDVKGS